jgi:hypothetical protein
MVQSNPGSLRRGRYVHFVESHPVEAIRCRSCPAKTGCPQSPSPSASCSHRRQPCAAHKSAPREYVAGPAGPATTSNEAFIGAGPASGANPAGPSPPDRHRYARQPAVSLSQTRAYPGTGTDAARAGNTSRPARAAPAACLARFWFAPGPHRSARRAGTGSTRRDRGEHAGGDSDGMGDRHRGRLRAQRTSGIRKIVTG